MPFYFTCEHCGETFSRFHRYRVNKPTRYCSKACANEAQRQPLAERLWRRVNRDGPVPTHMPELGPCWVFEGHRLRDGYGIITSQPRPSEGLGRKEWRAHRVAFMVTYGEIPDGQQVCHRCDNPSCVRPEHLFLCTQFENMADMTSKGRRAPSPNRWK